MRFGYVLPNNWGLPDMADLAVEADVVGLAVEADVVGLAVEADLAVEGLEAQGRTRDSIVVAPRITTSEVPDQAFVEAGADQLIVGSISPDIETIRADMAHLATLLTN